jgi:hypothetical protein
MPNKKFFITWIVSAIFMYAISYVWHGVVLNDLSRLTFPKDVFLSLAAIAYLCFGFALAIAIHFITYKQSKVVRGIVFGIPLGLFVYLIAFVFGISFNASPQMAHVIMDVTWQVIEQGSGGLVGGFVYSLVAFQEKVAKQHI